MERFSLNVRGTASAMGVFDLVVGENRNVREKPKGGGWFEISFDLRENETGQYWIEFLHRVFPTYKFTFRV